MEKFRLVYISGVSAVILPPEKREQEKNYQLNLAMKNLYFDGCRRMRTIRLPRTGDGEKYKVMGWHS